MYIYICHAMPCHVMPCHAIPYYAILYNSMQYSLYFTNNYKNPKSFIQNNIAN